MAQDLPLQQFTASKLNHLKISLYPMWLLLFLYIPKHSFMSAIFHVPNFTTLKSNEVVKRNAGFKTCSVNLVYHVTLVYHVKVGSTGKKTRHCTSEPTSLLRKRERVSNRVRKGERIDCVCASACSSRLETRPFSSPLTLQLQVAHCRQEWLAQKLSLPKVTGLTAQGRHHSQPASWV